MDLPDAVTLNIFNKVLLSLVELCPDGEFCSSRTLIAQCRSVAHGGQIVEYPSLLNECKIAGLIQIKSSRIRLSSLGQKLLSANKQRFFEVTEGQKQIIAERIVFRGAWSPAARALFEFFEVNPNSECYELSKIDSEIPRALAKATQLFKHLGILHEEEFKILVNRRYSQLVYELTADAKALSELELERILVENRKLGAQGENAVVEFEKRRLLKLGKPAQAELVRRISTVNVAAGYDIESFDGTTDDIVPDRFIEVKATTGSELRFYWTNNERTVAQKKKNQYWIYALVEFRENKPNECPPVMIQHPAKNIPKHSFLTIEAHTFLIRETGSLELEKFALEEVEWYGLK